MKIKMKQAVDLHPLYEIIKSKILPMKTSYKIARFFSSIEKQYEFYHEQIDLLIYNYSEKDEEGHYVSNGTGVKIQEDKIAECQEKIDELCDLEVEISDMKFTFEELEPLELSIEQFMLLIDFCEEEKQA